MCLPCMSLGDSLELNNERLQERAKRLEAVELLEVFRAREGRQTRQKINSATVLLSLGPQGSSLCS